MKNLSEKLIIILGIIILGSITLAQSPVDTLSGDNTPVIERKRKPPKAEKEIKQNPATPKQEKQAEINPTKNVTKEVKKTKVGGLTIYDNRKPKQQPTKKSKYRHIRCAGSGYVACKTRNKYTDDDRYVNYELTSEIMTEEELEQRFSELFPIMNKKLKTRRLKTPK